tara:strand:- start:638 stop:976 length:339 start_codon:yes stop_codon:yes gene_type:complete
MTMKITKENAYAVAKELEHQSKSSDSLCNEIATAIEVVEHNSTLSRKIEDVFSYFADNKLTHSWELNEDGKVDHCLIHKEFLFEPLVRMPCNGISSKALRQAIEYVMDQDEL